MEPMHRRDFLAAALVAGGAARGANERVPVGLIGCGGRGRYVASKMRDAGGVEFAAMCDVYQPLADKGREWAGPSAQAYTDFRRLLDRKDLDAVIVATPDHWHAIATIQAIQAGKDVYVEKPLAHNIHECQAMAAAAQRAIGSSKPAPNTAPRRTSRKCNGWCRAELWATSNSYACGTT